jgi:hypothetical protein
MDPLCIWVDALICDITVRYLEQRLVITNTPQKRTSLRKKTLAISPTGVMEISHSKPFFI